MKADVLPNLYPVSCRVLPFLSRYPSLDHLKLEFPAFEAGNGILTS